MSRNGPFLRLSSTNGPAPIIFKRPRLVAWVVVGTGVAEFLADLSHISLDYTAMDMIQLCVSVRPCVLVKKNMTYLDPWISIALKVWHYSMVHSWNWFKGRIYGKSL